MGAGGIGAGVVARCVAAAAGCGAADAGIAQFRLEPLTADALTELDLDITRPASCIVPIPPAQAHPPPTNRVALGDPIERNRS